MNFLTPNSRGHRAKSMLATTRASKNVQTTASNVDDWSPGAAENQETQEDQLSIQKFRSNTRRRKA